MSLNLKIPLPRRNEIITQMYKIFVNCDRYFSLEKSL
jgi:hypothetical protein